jgi:uncharacterized PurR-regulated membrane protein YhhQ (DUF165 family)
VHAFGSEVKLNNNKFLIALTISLVYLTFSLACDPLAYRLVSIFGVTTSGSVILYPALYPMLDMLTRMMGKTTVIIMIIIFHFCDFLFSYALFLVNLMPTPNTFDNLQAFNTVITPIPRLFWAGILGAISAGIIEVVIFSFLLRKIRNFFFSTYIATSIVIIGHGVPTDYFAFSTAFPDQAWSLVIANNSINITILSIYILIASFFIFLIRKNAQ